MVRRINGDIGRGAGWTIRSGDGLRQGRGGRVGNNAESSSRSGGGINRSDSDPSVVEVSRVWDSAGSKPKGRFDAYDQFGRAPLGMYVDFYA